MLKNVIGSSKARFKVYSWLFVPKKYNFTLNIYLHHCVTDTYYYLCSQHPLKLLMQNNLNSITYTKL